MKYIKSLIILLIFTTIMFVHNIPILSKDTENSVVYGNNELVTTSSIECANWSNWYDFDSSYCGNSSSILCVNCIPGDPELQDQIRKRDCWNTETGEEWVDYEHRTIMIDCCGICIPIDL